MKRCSDLASWLSYISERHTPEIILGLERITGVAEQLGLTHFHCPVITVAGTNGKGSTVAFLQQLYSTAGYRVGAYFSPHLHHFTERVMINNQPVKEAVLCEAFEVIYTACKDIAITFFEFITLAALLVFKNSDLDVLILEVGLGGRLDAVNCVHNNLAILTQIELDHCDRLGYDRDSIGKEKAGIFRKNAIAICGDLQPPNSVLTFAKSLPCTMLCVGDYFNYSNEGAEWSWWTREARFNNLPRPKLPLLSAACAIMATQQLMALLPVTRNHLGDALKNTYLPGRFEVIQSICPVILDVAHNAASADLLAQQLLDFPDTGKTYAIFSLLADKDCDAVLGPLGGLVDEWHVLQLDVPRAANADEIVQRIKALFNQSCYNHPDIAIMWRTLSKVLQPQDRVVVYGSFYTVAAVQKIVVAPAAAHS